MLRPKRQPIYDVETGYIIPPDEAGGGPGPMAPPAVSVPNPSAATGPAQPPAQPPTPDMGGGQVDPLGLIGNVLANANGPLGGIGRALVQYQQKKQQWAATNRNYQFLVNQGLSPAEAMMRAGDGRLMTQYLSNQRKREFELEDAARNRSFTLQDRAEDRANTLADTADKRAFELWKGDRDYERARGDQLFDIRSENDEKRKFAEFQHKLQNESKTERVKNYDADLKDFLARNPGKTRADFPSMHDWDLTRKKAGAMRIGTKGFSEFEKTTGEKVTEWTQGKDIDTKMNVQRLQSSIARLRSQPGVTGVVPGMVLGIGGDLVASILTPETRRIQQDIETVAQRSMKEILGAQFAKVEGEQLLARAFNPALHPAVNAQRAEAIMFVLQKGIERKDSIADHFIKHRGDMSGYQRTQNVERELMALQQRWDEDDRKHNVAQPARKTQAATQKVGEDAGNSIGSILKRNGINIPGFGG